MGQWFEFENREIYLSDDEISKIHRYQELQYHKKDVIDGIISKCNDDEELAKQYIENEELINNIVKEYEDGIMNDGLWITLVETAISDHIIDELSKPDFGGWVE